MVVSNGARDFHPCTASYNDCFFECGFFERPAVRCDRSLPPGTCDPRLYSATHFFELYLLPKMVFRSGRLPMWVPDEGRLPGRTPGLSTKLRICWDPGLCPLPFSAIGSPLSLVINCWLLGPCLGFIPLQSPILLGALTRFTSHLNTSQKLACQKV